MWELLEIIAAVGVVTFALVPGSVARRAAIAACLIVGLAIVLFTVLLVGGDS
jgi:hypothetical protein